MPLLCMACKCIYSLFLGRSQPGVDNITACASESNRAGELVIWQRDKRFPLNSESHVDSVRVEPKMKALTIVDMSSLMTTCVRALSFVWGKKNLTLVLIFFMATTHTFASPSTELLKPST